MDGWMDGHSQHNSRSADWECHMVYCILYIPSTRCHTCQHAPVIELHPIRILILFHELGLRHQKPTRRATCRRWRRRPCDVPLAEARARVVAVPTAGASCARNCAETGLVLGYRTHETKCHSYARLELADIAVEALACTHTQRQAHTIV
jgi:hypothetical protein